MMMIMIIIIIISSIVKLYIFVLLLSSHYFEPKMPDTIFLETFHGLVLHSHDYRYPETFMDRNVMVLGAGPSGIDIAIEISPLVEKVTFPFMYLLSSVLNYAFFSIGSR